MADISNEQEIKWHSLSTKDVIDKLQSSSNGLSGEEANKRLSRFGLNELTVKEEISPFIIFLRQFKDPLIIILLIATLLSAILGDFFDAALIVGIVFFSAALGFIQEYQAEKAVDELKKMLSPVSSVIRDGIQVEIPSKYIVPGDIIMLEAGNRVPADARLIESTYLKVDESSLTGESVPVEKTVKQIPEDTGLADRNNMVYSGTEVNYGLVKAVVVATGMTTELGFIASEVGSVEDEVTPLEKRTAEIGKWFGIIAVSICLFVAVSGIAKQSMADGFSIAFALSMLMFTVALAVAAVPEALAGIVTGTLAIGMREMAKNNAIIRKMPAVETLGSVTVICSDKTGTITKGEMNVRKIFSSGVLTNVSGTGYEPSGRFDPEYTDECLYDFIRAGLLCNDSSLITKNEQLDIKGDPTEGALLVLASKANFNIDKFHKDNPKEKEIPFSSERKRMTTVHRTEDDKRFAFMKGAPEEIVPRCKFEAVAGDSDSIGEDRKSQLKDIAESMANEGLRVLALAMKELQPDEQREEMFESNMTFLGFAGMIDQARTEAIDAVKKCIDIGITPVMITGDHKLTAKAVAKEAGIFSEGDEILTGTELDDLSEDQFREIVTRVTVYARVSPIHKMRIINAWKDKGEVVAMTGDGVNDAPALKRADIGIAMGITGTEVSKEASDMILADDNFATIIKAIERGRWIYDNIKKYLAYLLRANIVEVVILGGVAIIMGIEFLPLLPAAILYINLITDGLPAIALGVSPSDPDIMERPPRNPDESIFSRDVKLFILLGLIVEIPIFFWVFFSSGTLEDARTSLFFLFVLIELVIAINFRSLSHSIFRVRPHKWLVASVAGSIIVTFILVQFHSVREAFGINMPIPDDLIIFVALSAAVTLAFEITKFYIRKYNVANNYSRTK